MRRDIEKIKTLSICDFLERKGVTVPAHGNVCAFWRGDTNPSVSVDRIGNRWYDHGTGQGGSILDLVMAIERCSFSQAVDILEGGSSSFTVVPISSVPRTKESALVVDSVCEIRHPALLQYLSARCISPETARKYCKQVHYHHIQKPGSQYFAIGFQNKSGGWELRNTLAKQATGKDFSLILNGGSHLAIFEGFFDLLSYLELPDSVLPKRAAEGFLVLNSVALVDRALLEFPEGISSVSLLLDTDAAGRRATARIEEAMKERCIDVVLDAGPILESYGPDVGDVNDLLQVINNK